MVYPSRSKGPPSGATSYVGHSHFWQRAVSRGQFIRTTAGATGVVLGSQFLMPAVAQADSTVSGVLPRPIPGGIPFLGPGKELFHVLGVAPASELSTITDFNGAIGAAHLQGPATRTLSNGAKTTLYGDYDLRFMQGQYLGVDGKLHYATFSFF